MSGLARYDGHADWYDETFSAPYAEDPSIITEFLGRGDGQVCVEVACGTARHARLVTEAGYRFIGIDFSADQLRRARQHSSALVRANATHLPVRPGSIEVALGLYFHTDIEDVRKVMAEVSDALAQGGRFLYVGLHPCFIGGFVDRTVEPEEAALTFVPGYGEAGWTNKGSGGGSGLWARVGGHHKTLHELVGSFIEAGLNITRLDEPWGGGTVLPRTIVIATQKP